MHETRRKFRDHIAVMLLALAWGGGLLPGPASAQAYPDKPIRMIVAWPPGGGTDSVARIVARHLSERLKQQVVIENRSGASGQVGSEYVARATPDGYTLQYTVADSHSINPHVFPNVRYDALKDFVPVAMTGSMPNALAVSTDVPANSRRRVHPARARRSPASCTLLVLGHRQRRPHPHAVVHRLHRGNRLLHVPFQGSGPGFAAVLGGQVDAMMVPLGLAESNYQGGQDQDPRGGYRAALPERARGADLRRAGRAAQFLVLARRDGAGQGARADRQRAEQGGRRNDCRSRSARRAAQGRHGGRHPGTEWRRRAAGRSAQVFRRGIHALGQDHPRRQDQVGMTG